MWMMMILSCIFLYSFYHLLNSSNFSGEAVFARCLSALKPERVQAAARFPRKKVDIDAIIPDKREFIKKISKVGVDLIPFLNCMCIRLRLYLSQL